MTLTTPCRLITLQSGHLGFTEDPTFIFTSLLKPVGNSASC